MEKLSKGYLDSLVVSTSYVHNELLTLCILTLKNGFQLVGQSACLSAEYYDTDIGENVAYQNAFEKLWELEGYLWKQCLHDKQKRIVTLRNGSQCEIIHESRFGKLLAVCVDEETDELPEVRWHNNDGSFYANKKSEFDIIINLVK
ncbi:hypothetical protein FHQ28_01535 [Pasteurellaceae bacterium USgator11]|nr:hypothetical protein FHQ20_09080 [Pasteurellaceae bacterium USgator41]TNG96938.1 hypothetical protein FHQ19_00890 [Pasteurellaceae bacterium UScroc12]TNG97858.1 hypothetical protein FHQ24_09695 [Pasteurellaceae bacterium UScroc31]TNH02909.1 hypothetical protein FHQ28_01535 [Pasteurellaceae bacterium USgator11]